MLDYYFQKALKEDLPIGDFMNVIRIILKKAPTHQGADGDDHYLVIKAKVNKFIKLQNVEVVESESDEEIEINDIIECYENPTPQVQSTKLVTDDNGRKISNQLKKDNSYFDLLDENSIDNTEDEFNYG